MPPTKRGVYHNLKESKYVVSNEDITFFFSSEHTLNNFINRHKINRQLSRQKIEKVFETSLNLDVLSDIETYKDAEKRGFYVWLKGVSITWEELNQYALRKMSDDVSPVWCRIERPNISQRFRSEKEWLISE